MSDPAAHAFLGRVCERGQRDQQSFLIDVFLPSLPPDHAPVIVKFLPCRPYITKACCSAPAVFRPAMQSIFCGTRGREFLAHAAPLIRIKALLRASHMIASPR